MSMGYGPRDTPEDYAELRGALSASEQYEDQIKSLQSQLIVKDAEIEKLKAEVAQWEIDLPEEDYWKRQALAKDAQIRELVEALEFYAAKHH